MLCEQSYLDKNRRICSITNAKCPYDPPNKGACEIYKRHYVKFAMGKDRRNNSNEQEGLGDAQNGLRMRLLRSSIFNA